MTKKISDIKIGPRFRKDLGDIDTLAKSIKKIGLLHPVVINRNDELVAGARRIEACKKLGWAEIPVTTINLDNIIKGELDENTERVDFKFSERMAILEEIERQRSNLERDSKNKGRRSAEIAATLTNISPAQMYKEKRVLQTIRDNPSLDYLIKEIDDGDITVNLAAQIVEANEAPDFVPVPTVPTENTSKYQPTNLLPLRTLKTIAIGFSGMDESEIMQADYSPQKIVRLSEPRLRDWTSRMDDSDIREMPRYIRLVVAQFQEMLTMMAQEKASKSKRLQVAFQKQMKEEIEALKEENERLKERMNEHKGES